MAGLAVDEVIRFDGVLCLVGWLFGSASLEVEADGAGAWLGFEIVYFDRVDVTESYRLQGHRAQGFLLVAADTPTDCPLRVRISGRPDVLKIVPPVLEDNRHEIGALLNDHIDRLGVFLRAAATRRRWVAAILPLLRDAPAHFMAGRAYLEHARGVAGLGGVVGGWAIGVPPAELFALSSDGAGRRLSEATRWYRKDIEDAFHADYGAYALAGGFVLGLDGDIDLRGRIVIACADGAEAYAVARADWKPAPTDPASFARWVFELPTPNEGFGEQIERHHLSMINELIRRRVASLESIEPAVKRFGEPNEKPLCSILIPLYGRHEFMWNQLLAFADDKFIRDYGEIIYVIDDPRIRDQVLADAADLHVLTKVPFTVVDGRTNRGYSGANNLGFAHSTADLVLLLNSDVIPIEAGWLQKMIRVMARSRTIGIVGSRLLYWNGAVQHDGMAFEPYPAWNVHLNKHPGAGMPPGPHVIVNPPAVTGACLLMKSDDYRALGGLDPYYLLGDFEDSDLCLKARSSGLEVAMVTDVELVHLERQSFAGIGMGQFRSRVVHFNARRHEQKWGDYIRANGLAVSTGTN